MNFKLFTITVLFLVIAIDSIEAQLTPQVAIKNMSRGINMGNTFDAPDGETSWNNPVVVESNFEDYKAAGFNCVRLPVTWDKHTGIGSPYSIQADFLNRVEQVVNWGLKHKLIIILNAHHDQWIKNNYSTANIARFDSIWGQISRRFRNHSDSLLFEIINEPEPLSLNNVNDLNARTIKTIRKTNPTRIIIFSGHRWSNSQELLAAAVPIDNYLMGYYHSYDPYPFGLLGTGSYGTDSDISNTNAKFISVANWSTTHNIPVVLSEFGAINKCEYNARMCLYATDVEKALINNVAFNAWDDGGDFRIYERSAHKWNEIKDILIYTYKESPNKLKIQNLQNAKVRIQWQNRTTLNDSIIIERKVNSGDFTFLKKISPLASEYIDSTATAGSVFYYRLKANVKDSIEIQSYPIRVTASLTSVKNESVENFTVYPNPSSGIIRIPGVKKNTEIEFYNGSGVLVKKVVLKEGEETIPVHMFLKGLYMIKYSDGNKVYSSKFIKE